MANYYVNGLIKSLPKKPRSTVGLTLLKKTLKKDLNELNVPYQDPCCDSDVTSVRLNRVSGALEVPNIAGDNWVLLDGVSANSMIAGFYPTVAQNNIAAGAGGAISITNYLTTINTDAGGDAFTLANGVQKGQRKKIRLVVDGTGDGVVTPATPLLGGATTITFNDAGDYVELIWNGTAWAVLDNFGTTIA